MTDVCLAVSLRGLRDHATRYVPADDERDTGLVNGRSLVFEKLHDAKHTTVRSVASRA